MRLWLLMLAALVATACIRAGPGFPSPALREHGAEGITFCQRYLAMSIYRSAETLKHQKTTHGSHK